MRYLIILPFLCVIACNHTETSSPEDLKIKINPESLKYAEYFQALTKLDEFNGCVLVRQGDELLVRLSFNMEEVGHPMHVTHESQFDVHSVSKLMARALIIDLEGQGILSRTDLLSDHIPDFPRGDEITLEHLLKNNSGLPRELSEDEKRSTEWTTLELIEAIKLEPLEFEPGSDTRYSNLGYQLVYYIISQKIGKPFGECMSEDVFAPLGMDHSGAHPYQDKVNLKHYVSNFEADDEGPKQVPSYFIDSQPQARLFSTIDDLDIYLSQLGKPEYSSLINSSGVIAWAGGSDGIRAYVECNPKEDYHFVILANYDGIPLEQCIKDMRHMLRGEAYAVPAPVNRKAVHIDSETLRLYEGRYDFVEADHLILDLKLVEDSLTLFQDGEAIATLMAENDSVFFADPNDKESFTFNPSQGYETVIMDWLGTSFRGERIVVE